MEESPSDSGLSDGTKTTNHEEISDSIRKNSSVIDLSKPLCKEEMLALIQILRELWKKQFGSEIPDMEIKPIIPTSNLTSIRRMSCLPNNNKSQYHSTPALNKLSAELNDIKDKLKRFSTGRATKEEQQPQRQTSPETKSNGKIFILDTETDRNQFLL
jgi:hypothetical protein